MGAKQSARGQGRRGTKQLLGTTSFTRKELREIRRKFHKDYPVGYLTFQEYHRVFLAFLPLSTQHDSRTHVYEKHLFRSFDSNGDGKLDFGEFVQALSVLRCGSVEEMLEWMFRLCDIDGDGELTKDDIAEIANSCRMMRMLIVRHTFDDIHLDLSDDAISRTSSIEETELMSCPRRVKEIARAQAFDLFSDLDDEGSGRVSRDAFLRKGRNSFDIQTKMRNLLQSDSESVEV